MEKNVDDIDDLIGKVLALEATAEEQVLLQNWISRSENNRKYYEQLRFIFERAAGSEVQLQFDADVAWKNVKQRIHAGKPDAKTRSLKNYAPIGIAAGIVLLLAVGIFTYRWSAPEIQTFATATDSSTVQDTLPDGSTAFLNKKSALAFEYNPRKKTRKVKLSGEGFFEIKHEEEKPFVIETDEVIVRDIGTAFNVRAYPQSDTVEVSVQTGEVQFYTLKDPGLNLVAGETGIYSKHLKAFSKLPKADTNILAYKTGVFSFNNTDLQGIIDKINEVYGSHIRLNNPKLAHCPVTVNFNNEKLEDVVDIIAQTLNLTITRREKEILLDGRGCE